jgi:hypothetical protein
MASDKVAHFSVKSNQVIYISVDKQSKIIAAHEDSKGGTWPSIEQMNGKKDDSVCVWVHIYYIF